MADLARGSGRPPSRRSREQRAYRIAVTGGGAAAVAVVGGLLALIGVLGWTLPVIAAIVAAVCFFLFRRTVS
ncbi:MAG: hypothetical protein ACRDL4_07405 [Thermoleophilaceae bacterium]